MRRNGRHPTVYATPTCPGLFYKYFINIMVYVMEIIVYLSKPTDMFSRYHISMKMTSLNSWKKRRAKSTSKRLLDALKIIYIICILLFDHVYFFIIQILRSQKTA